MGLAKLVDDRRIGKRARRLNRAVQALPLEARRAMLAAIADGDLVIGAYADHRGHVCPMLAAHRRGARIDVGDFPRAWDTFGRARRPRLATARELEVLRALLEESIPTPAGTACGAERAPSRA